MIQEDGVTLSAYEIKLSANIHTDFYKNLQYFRSLFPNETITTQIINTGEFDNPDPLHGHISYLRIFE